MASEPTLGNAKIYSRLRTSSIRSPCETLHVEDACQKLRFSCRWFRSTGAVRLSSEITDVRNPQVAIAGWAGHAPLHRNNFGKSTNGW